MEELIYAMVPITGIITTGAVLILRPLSKRLGMLLEVMIQEKRRPAVAPAGPELEKIRELLSGIDGRLLLIEERQDFAEALISTDPRLLAGGTPQPAPDTN